MISRAGGFIRKSINPDDINAFATASGLPAFKFSPILVPGTVDPGRTADEPEADLDPEWSGTVARNATIVYIYAPNVLESLQYALSPPTGTSLAAPVVSMSYGGCETEFIPVGAP